MANYSWVAFFKELGEKLIPYENKQEELITIIKKCGITEGLNDQDKNGKDFELDEIDPFTFYSFFMKYKNESRRSEYMSKLKTELNIDSTLPTQFSGVPTAQAQRVWLFRYKAGRQDSDIPNLWKLFKQSRNFQVDETLFQDVLRIEGVGKAKITEALFYTDPEIYFPIDKQTRAYLEKKGIEYEFDSFAEYLNIIKDVQGKIDKPLFQISYEAWFENQQSEPRFWRIGTHNDAGESYWEQMKNENFVAIGWSDLGDLNEIDKLSKEKIVEAFVEAGYDQPKNHLSRKAGEIYNFARTIEIDDIVLAAVGMKILGIGIVTGDYYFDEKIPFSHIRKVEWKYLGNELPELAEGLRTTVVEIGDKNIQEKIKKLLSNTNIMNGKPIIQNPLNQILFGPPGTGKTYNTINKAVEIIDPEFYKKNSAPDKREELKKRFDDLRTSGQIEFVTFHQSMSYEDFIEGIKPKIEIDHFDNKKSMIYDVEAGVFQEISSKARDNYYKSTGTKFEEGSVPFDVVYKILLDELDKSADGKLKINLHSSHFFITEVDAWGSIKMENINKNANNTMTESSIRKIYNAHGEMHIRGGMKTYYKALYGKLVEYAVSLSKEKTKTENKNFVLVIDEINRGNVSQIFGELITLIEEDKRIGKAEALSATLPYSQNPFSVPPNLYLIGTMNTADRSVEALDTALRRRFSFVEVPPDMTLLDKINVDGIDIKQLVESINKRIEKLLNKDHCIGHSYFMSIKGSADQLNLLKEIFHNKILPLLQEYFYGDFGKIGLVLGDKFIEIENNPSQNTNIFASFKGYDSDLKSDLAERMVYKLVPSEKWNKDSFISIYSGSQ